MAQSPSQDVSTRTNQQKHHRYDNNQVLPSKETRRKKESEAVVVEASTLKGTFEKAKKWFPKKEHSSECTRT